jgi:hypothetical protein
MTISLQTLSKYFTLATALLLILAACAQAPARPAPPVALLPIDVATSALSGPAQPCSGSFVVHDLDFVAMQPGGEARMFDANGAGAAIGDLDADGQLDIVLANQRGSATILWNGGDLRFRAERLPQRDTRAVNLVDVDGDGQLDIVFTQRIGAPTFWRNTGGIQPNASTSGARFERELLPGVAKPAYAIAWGDLDGNGSLDLVTGSYDAALLTDLGNSFLLGGGAGVYVYAHQGDRFIPTQLARSSQALAIALYDFNGDGKRDIVVGNDFAVRDQAWSRQGDGWVPAAPFDTSSHSTMSFDQADVDNNGMLELFSTDMKPYNNDVATLARWRPFMTALWDPVPIGDPQLMENVLQVPNGHGGFRNEGYERGIDATGWSWSGEFGDLDDDGFLDLYVVNGMIESRILHYLPDYELVEQNQALRNDGAGHFVPRPDWGLGATASGRGMSMADLDGDGDLDIVVNNLRGPAQLFENRVCGGASLEVDLGWPASKNTRALGVTLTLRTSAGSYSREVRAAVGYLSGAPARVHIGFPTNATLYGLDIRWPDGAVSSIGHLEPHTLLAVTRN